ncbi:MAG: MbnP family protein [Flavobacteriales bacterium]
MKKNIFALMMGTMAIALTFSSCKKDDDDEEIITPVATTGTVKLEMEHTFGDEEFALGTAYTTGSGESVTFNTTKYYVSNVQFHKADGTTWSQPESYYLVNLEADGSNILDITGVPTGDYTDVTFTIGVDSTRNVSGAQTGALSIANAMFWTWNSGYIMIKLEGDCPQSSNGSFAYHLGGFYGANSSVNTGTFSFDPAILSVSPSATPQIHMAVDIKQFFDNPDHVHTVAMGSNITMPGAMAATLADNFFSGIEFEHIHN